MKVLIVLGNISPSDDANTNIAKLLATEILSQGNDVSMLGTSFLPSVEHEQIEGVHYHRILKIESEKKRQLAEKWSNTSGMFKIIEFAMLHPYYFVSLCVRYCHSKICDEKEHVYRRRIRDMLSKEKYDRIIAITSPFYVASAVIKEAKNIDVVWYQLDPNHSNITLAYKNKKNLLEKEIALYERIKFAVVPKLVYEENEKNQLSKFQNKMKPAEFPNVRMLGEQTLEDFIVFTSDRINVVFVGTFYEDIRNPEPLLEAIAKMDSENIMFHFIGGGCQDIIERWMPQCQSKLMLHGYHSLDAALNAMQMADFLINIDNKAKNMLPSKINDYISACKPIINIHPYVDNASVGYLERYPLCLNLCVEGVSPDEMAQKIEMFCCECVSKDISFESIKGLYKESTPQFVAQLLME